MEKTPTVIGKFISDWNNEFPDYTLTTTMLTDPHAVIGAIFQVFDRLGIDRDAVVMPPPEENRNEHTMYYWDLLPVINVTRVFTHLMSAIPQIDATISDFLQPTIASSHSIILLIFNLMMFNEDRLNDIAPHEEELFSKMNQVKSLEDRKNQLLEMLNQQAEEKGKRAERLEKLELDIKQFEEELKIEKAAKDDDQQQLDELVKENRQLEIVLEQKKGHRDALLADIEKKKALRVYDADDIQTQVAQSAQNVQEAEEKLTSLRATLLQKENNLMNLQNIKPNLDTCNILLHDIMKLAESLRDGGENGDLELDSKEGELDVLNTEASELEAQLAEIKAARAEAEEKRQAAEADRRQIDARLISALREAEEKDKKCKEQCNKAIQQVQEIKECTLKYEQEKAEGTEQIVKINETFIQELKSIEEALITKVKESKKQIEEKLRRI